MSLRRWRTAYACVAGTSHIASSRPCQDAGLATVIQVPDGSEILLAGVSDGAGSASRSDRGANLVVNSFVDTLRPAILSNPDLAFLSRDFVLLWLADVRRAIEALASQEGHTARDYACTFLGAVVGSDVAGYVQIGDGAIIVADQEDGEYNWVFWPQHGEFANSTFFVTHDGAEELLQFKRTEFAGEHAYVREIGLFSDGIERLVLDLANRAVHSPSLRPIFGWLAGTEPVSEDRPSEVLSTYLSSNPVNIRTDDDKTLVMATRAGPHVRSL